MAKNYYGILGVGADATEEEIKSAYRREAKRCHPDRSGEDCEPFRIIHEAYEVLGDPERRRAYDQKLAREERAQAPRPPAVGPVAVRRGRPPVEPLVPGRDHAVPGRDPGRWGTPRPYETAPASPLSALVEDLLGNWRGPGVTPRSSAGREEIHVEVTLTPREALHGSRARLWVPAPIPCPACHGRGESAFFVCPHCLGRGAVVGEAPVDVALPGGLVDGSGGRLRLGRPGMSDLVLVLHVRVEGRA